MIESGPCARIAFLAIFLALKDLSSQRPNRHLKRLAQTYNPGAGA